MAKMTVKEVEALKAKDKPYKKNVDIGLQIRVSTNGAKAWVVQYVVNGKQREYRLPRLYGSTTDGGYLSLLDARREAARIRALARDGLDFQVQQEEARRSLEKQKAEAERSAAAEKERQQTENLTVNDLFKAWLEDGVRRKDGNAELRRSFSRDVLPQIGNLEVRSLTEHDLRKLLRKLVERGVNRLAVITYNNLRQMFLWAEKRQPWRKLMSEGNPVQLIEIEKIINPDYEIRNQRARILSSEEIRELNQVFVTMRTEYDESPNRRSATRPVAKATELAIWIMLSTMCRVGELSMARWEHVDFDSGEWFIPRQNTKGHHSDLTVYMSAFTLRQFKSLQEITGHSEWCFPARNKEGHLCVKNISKQVGDRQVMFKKDTQGNARKVMNNRSRDANALVLSGGKNGDWTPHDLRRTGATMMQALGISLDIIDRCQNHVLHGSKVRRHYLHHDYADEKRDAWRRLGEALTEMLGGAKADAAKKILLR